MGLRRRSHKKARIDPRDLAGTEAFLGFDNSLSDLARLIFRSFSVLREARTRDYGITVGEWTFLRQLWCEDGINQHELCRRLALRDSTAVVALRSMERANLVCRRVNPESRRETLVFLTTNAKQLESVLLPIAAEIQCLATRGLSIEEVRTLRTLLLRLIDNLSFADPHLRGSFPNCGASKK